MHGTALLAMVALSAQLSSSDRAVLRHLRSVVPRLENQEISLGRFERLVPRTEVVTWQRLQHRLSPSQSGAADLAFVLAYYGVDYQRNLRRLLAYYERSQRASGSAGETIQILNPVSKKRFPARVEGKGRVSVKGSL